MGLTSFNSPTYYLGITITTLIYLFYYYYFFILSFLCFSSDKAGRRSRGKAMVPLRGPENPLLRFFYIHIFYDKGLLVTLLMVIEK